MNESIIADIEQRLGKRLDPNKEWSITSLNDLPPDVVADARFLGETASSVLRTALLWFYIPTSEHVYLPSFIDDVINGGENPATWERGGALYLVATEVRRLLERSASEFLSPLQVAGGDSPEWLRIAPNPILWEEGDAVTGSPAVAPAGLDYHWHTLYGVARTIDPNHHLETITEDIQVTTRRWIASRLAWAARKARVSLLTLNADTVVQELLPGQTVMLSDDARIAIQALQQEEQSRDAMIQGSVPGFRGPEEWFCDGEKVEANP